MDKLTVQADIAVGSRGNPTVTNTLRNMAEVTTCTVVHTGCYLLLPASLPQIMIRHLQSCYRVLVKVSFQCLCHTWCISLCPKGNRLVCIILLPLTALQAASFSISICAGCKVFRCMAPTLVSLVLLCLLKKAVPIMIRLHVLHTAEYCQHKYLLAVLQVALTACHHLTGSTEQDAPRQERSSAVHHS